MSGARTARRWLSVLGLLGVLLIAAAPLPAEAHPLSTTAVLLDVTPSEVDATVELPLDQLGQALGQSLTATGVLAAPELSALRTYVGQHLSATGPSGQPWTTAVTGGRVGQIDGVDQLVLDATLEPGSGTTGDLVVHCDLILAQIASHRIFVLGREGHDGPYATLAMLSFQRASVPVRSSRSSDDAGFISGVRLGIAHISSGSDHLLFLLMLLLPAPLLVRAGRWHRRQGLGAASRRVVHVVTAFALGHSVTLALGAAGLVHLPARLVESGIALSIVVSALHAVRPLARRGEALIAVGFGLLHGLAFASVLAELRLSRSGLLVDLLGFNLGIELTQLVVVGLVMPSLYLLSRTAVYSALRVTTAGLGVVVASGWLLQRTGATRVNPLEPVADLLVTHPVALALGLALCAVLTSGSTSIRPREPHAGPPPASHGRAAAPVAARPL